MSIARVTPCCLLGAHSADLSHKPMDQRMPRAPALELRATQAALPPGLDQIQGELSHVVEGLAHVQHELQEISRGIHPAILSDSGVGPAVKALARRSPVPVDLDLRVAQRLPEQIEVAAYYVVSEMLTNAAKHANAAAVPDLR